MYADLYKKYRADWDPLKAASDQKFIDCQGKVRVSKTDANDAINNFNIKYAEAQNDLTNMTDPQQKAVLEQKLTSVQNSFLQLRQQAQQQLTQSNTDGLTVTITQINKKRDDILNLMNDIAIVSQKKPNIQNAGAQQTGGNNINRNISVASKPGNANVIQQNNAIQYQKTADNYVTASNNSGNEVQTALNLNLAKINAMAAGNKAQVAQIQQQLNTSLQISLGNVISQLNDMKMRNSQRNADAIAYGDEEEDKRKRDWLYECIRNYSFWYLDTSLFIQTASSAISYRSGQPDYFMKPHENYNIESIKSAIKTGDFNTFYSSLIDPYHIDNVGQLWGGSSWREDFDGINYNFDGDVKQQQKLINKTAKNADKGDPIAALNLFSYYLSSKYNDPPAVKAEWAINADKYFDVVDHRLLLSKDIYTPLILITYFMRANAEKEPVKKLAYLQKIDSLNDIHGFSTFPTKLLSGNFSKYYSTEFYYYITYLNSWEKIKVYNDLYKQERAPVTKNDEYFNRALNEYLNIGVNLKPMFQDKKLQRPFTDDDKWNEHHPERNH